MSRVLGVRSSIVAPLAGHGRVFGALTLATAESGRRFSEQDLAVAEDLARRAALAIDNARLYGAEHDIAHALQQSLLPGTLTQPPGAEVVARYRPAGEGAEVGGDFYDAWQTGEHVFPRDRRRRRARPGRSRLDEPDAPGDARRQPLRAVARPHPGGRQRHDRRSERARAVLHGRARRPAPDRRRLFADGGLRRAPAARRRAGRDGRRRGDRRVRRAARGAPAARATTTASACSALGDLVAFWTDGVTERRHPGGMFGEERLLALLGGLGQSLCERRRARGRRSGRGFRPRVA